MNTASGGGSGTFRCRRLRHPQAGYLRFYVAYILRTYSNSGHVKAEQEKHMLAAHTARQACIPARG